MSVSADDINQGRFVAGEIRRQIGPMAFMSLGATNLHSITANEDYNGGLYFEARILPFNKNGERSSRPRVMQVTVTLTYRDLYDIEVRYLKGGDIVTHAELGDVYGDEIQHVMLALDSDTPEVFNPRYMGMIGRS